MFKSRILDKADKNKIDILFIFIIAIFTSILVYLLINANNQLGIYCSDVFIYLTNSLNLAGYPLGKTSNLYLSPVICIITSLIFKLGYINQIAIFTVTGLFFPIASIGTYFLFRLKLNKIISLFGAILFSSFSLNILWVANGTMDIPAIAITIWIIYFTILAVNRNPKYYLIVLPLFTIGFFIRYTVGFILPLMILYILFEIDIIEKLKILKSKNKFLSFLNKSNLKKILKSNNFKYFLIGIIIALLIFSLFLIFLNIKGTDLTFISQTQSAVSGDKGSSLDPGFRPEPYFYLENLGNFISSNSLEFHKLIPSLKSPGILSYFVLILISGGALLYILEIIFKNLKSRANKKYKIKSHIKNAKDTDNKKNGKNSKRRFYLKILLIIIISIIIIITYKKISSIISEIFFLINILLIYNILNKISNNDSNILNNKNNLNSSDSLNNKNNLNSSDSLNNKNNLNTLDSLNNKNNLYDHSADNKYESNYRPIKTLNFNLLMISWFFIYLIFFSFSDVKVDRYFITVMPVIAYFGAYSLNFLSLKIIKFLEFYKHNADNYDKKDSDIFNEKNIETVNKDIKKSNIKSESKIQCIITIILISIFIISAFNNVGIIPSKNQDVEGPIVISNWLKHYDPDYENKVIWTYNTRYYTWYLMMNVGAAYEKDIPKLEKNNVTYYISRNISKENYTIENYTMIKKYNNINLYKRNTN
ncbi:glycosyltransferase family 39 protein [Methanobrevibacter sp.]|uniref:glycosyltransferase family 39 protein n=1 Tax=Methanobrevibacter sp. TaxID=66852 RepID=UPI00262C8DAA|nr:glycosyltransferase family 39 protein [uncultured Methanobrevibacter sp.]